MSISEKARRGVFKIESSVFHFPEIKPAEGEPVNFARRSVAAHSSDMPPGGPSLTRQEFADECDINNIMQRYEATGVLPAVTGDPIYYDFTTLPSSMMDAMLVMTNASDAFMTLPASVRKQFDNDPALFVDFASQEENLDQMREWGLAPTPPPEPPEAPPVRVEVVSSSMIPPVEVTTPAPPPAAPASSPRPPGGRTQFRP